MIIRRVWAMPNKNTFEIKPIRELICKYLHKDLFGVDPFANTCRIATITNDLDPQFYTDYTLDALEFLQQFKAASVDYVLYDPPYSPRQVTECYKRLNKVVTMQTTQASYWSRHKLEISRIVKYGGVVFSCGWNSGGIGKKYSFEIQEILLVPHGGQHNDTIVVVDKKV